MSRTYRDLQIRPPDDSPLFMWPAHVSDHEPRELNVDGDPALCHYCATRMPECSSWRLYAKVSARVAEKAGSSMSHIHSLDYQRIRRIGAQNQRDISWAFSNRDAQSHNLSIPIRRRSTPLLFRQCEGSLFLHDPLVERRDEMARVVLLEEQQTARAHRTPAR